ncbi:hypothetical protein HY489_02510 [Candidatus Woesearchaeota archaeon]|nr:hypothetical protein [Candidatus Woesearchaeota archaeon]
MKAGVALILLILAACAAPEVNEESKAKQLAEQLRQQASEVVAKPTAEVQPAQTSEPTAQPATEPTPVTPEPVSIPAEQPVAPTAVQEEQTTPAEQSGIMYQLLDTFAKKVTGYQFIRNKDDYLVRGQRAKIKLDKLVLLKNIALPNGTTLGFYYYDTVYVDRTTKTATAYCEGHTDYVNRQCAQYNLYDLPLTVNYSKYNIMLPEDWLFANLNQTPARTEKDKYYVDGRRVLLVAFSDLELYFDTTNGLPIRADQKSNNALIKREDYESLASNKVRDIDVRHRTKEEIPSSETFYR